MVVRRLLHSMGYRYRLQRRDLPGRPDIVLSNRRAIISLEQKMVPPYRTDTFPNRWWKLIRDEPSRTLMAHLGKDCYSHIHYDGTQRRTISIREAARLQSFPDGFKFAGTMNPSLRHIGNAVPPLVSFEIAKVMRAALQAAAVRLERGSHPWE
jgi:DNA (cytosine-5)-methyltransferase 1